MKKNILIISTSPRIRGNSDTLANAFLKGALDAGHQAKKITLYDKQIGFCKGCLGCQQTGTCIIHDDVTNILKEMKDADAIAFATPIYFYEMCGQMKTFLDRTNPLFNTDYQFRDIYFLGTAADGESYTFDGAIHGLQGWIDCFEKTSLKGIVKGFEVTNPMDIQLKTELLEEAYQLGNRIF